MNEIRVAIAGVGNVASALLQGLAFEKRKGMRLPVNPVVGFDVNANKVGLPLSQAVRVVPNCANWLGMDLAEFSGPVMRGPLLDGLSPPLRELIPVDDNAQPVDVSTVLEELGVEVLIIAIPTGAQTAARYYAEAAIRARCAVVNGMPAEIVASDELMRQATEAGVPVIGDDMKSQVGATAIHRAVMELFSRRAAAVERTLQLDWGGDMDFMNLVPGDRYDAGKKRSKTESVIWDHPEVEAHISASDYIPFLKNRKEAYTRVEGTIFGGQKVRIDIHLEVEDAYNAAGVILPAAVCAGLALRQGISGPLDGPSAWLCKRPRVQLSDLDAFLRYQAFMAELTDGAHVANA